MSESPSMPIIDLVEIDEQDALTILASPQAAVIIGDTDSVSRTERAVAAFDAIARLVARRVAHESGAEESEVLTVIERELR